VAAADVGDAGAALSFSSTPSSAGIHEFDEERGVAGRKKRSVPSKSPGVVLVPADALPRPEALDELGTARSADVMPMNPPRTQTGSRRR
jgi:hypothetical protein